MDIVICDVCGQRIETHYLRSLIELIFFGWYDIYRRKMEICPDCYEDFMFFKKVKKEALEAKNGITKLAQNK
jgi:hypothetical protein